GTCLAAYGGACNIPFDSSEGGFHRYLSGYLILRKSMRLFGVLEPWEKFVAEGEGGRLSPFFDDAWTETLMKLIPDSENPIVEKLLGGCAFFKMFVGGKVGPPVTEVFQTVWDKPLTDDPWGPPPGPKLGQRKCTFCGGSGKRSSCSGCNGSGRVTRPGRD